MQTRRAFGGMMTAPHHLAAEAGCGVLREGGNAVEAMVAAAAAIAVVYPHMNAIGGDGFWLIAEPGKQPVAIDACGPAAGDASPEWYRERGFSAIPSRGPLAALTVPGTISGWQRALEQSAAWAGRLPLPRLLEPAIHYARDGVAVTLSQHANTAAKQPEMGDAPGFAETFLRDGRVPAVGERIRQPRLAATLERIGQAGPDDFYRGALARAMAEDLARLGSPLQLADFEKYAARNVAPLSVELSCGTVFNLPPPTQGLASLMILGIFERLGCREAESFDFVHGLVEATKQAFLVRDRHVTDPAYLTVDPLDFLTPATLAKRAGKVDAKTALAWPAPTLPGDTIWMGAIDGEGRAVSFIQSIYWEFGSGVVLPETGVLMQNRGTSFGLSPDAAQPLMPGRKPFHTLNPPLARLADGRVMVYGTMGGEGQPQTQAAIFTRYAVFGQDLQEAIAAPRWLLGRTWGAESSTLKLESRFPADLLDALKKAGHVTEIVGRSTDLMGHAGAVVRHSSGLLEGATDPRSDGAAAGF